VRGHKQGQGYGLERGQRYYLEKGWARRRKMRRYYLGLEQEKHENEHEHEHEEYAA